eukprot:scaffold13547_cov33-Prasinocladus_malaysianus.AAC.1
MARMNDLPVSHHLSLEECYLDMCHGGFRPRDPHRLLTDFRESLRLLRGTIVSSCCSGRPGEDRLPIYVAWASTTVRHASRVTHRLPYSVVIRGSKKPETFCLWKKTPPSCIIKRWVACVSASTPTHGPAPCIEDSQCVCAIRGDATVHSPFIVANGSNT